MAIDFLGKAKPVKKKIGPDVKYHLPEKEKVPKIVPPVKKPVPVIKKVEPPKPAPEQELGEANLMVSFKKNIRKKRLITILIILGIIAVAVIIGLALYYYIKNLPPAPLPPPVVKYSCNSSTGQCFADENGAYDSMNVCQSNCVAPLPIPVCGNNICETDENTQSCPIDCPAPAPKYSCNASAGQCFTDENGAYNSLSACQSNCFAPPPPPVCGNGICEADETTENCSSDCQPIILPDTELAPLRGALVKFTGDSNIYLIENNGELRKIEKQTVIFKNGQNIFQLDQNLIYTISSRFANTRHGKDVKGFIDWDPRVLSEQELTPFIY